VKIDNIVLVICAIVAGVMGGVYFLGLIIGVIQTGGLLLPVLVGFVAVIVIFGVVLKQRMGNAEDDHYENIER